MLGSEGGQSDQQKLFSKDRQLSRFLAQEMLYDYITDGLDENRRQAVEKFLEMDEELKAEEEAIRQAIRYCDELGKTDISEPLRDQIGSQFNVSNWVIGKLGWSQWPDLAKWAAEAAALSLVVAIGATFLPWDRLGFDRSTQEAKVTLLEKESADSVVPLEPENPPQEPGPAEQMTAVVAEKNEKVREQIKELEEKEQQAPPEKPQKTQEQIAAEQAKKREVEKRFEASKKKKVVAAPEGNPFVYRGNISSKNLDTITPILVKNIKALGGVKGGKVEIGWRKPNASYFHFVVDEEHLDKIKQYFNAYGNLNLTKTPHRRVMPAGSIRFIIEVKDASINQ